VIKIPRYTGREIDGDARTELDHYANCPVCGALIDLRDLAAVMVGKRLKSRKQRTSVCHKN
jgi:hypothetical protein